MLVYEGYSDHDLFFLLQSGNENAFNAIFDRYHKRLFIEAFAILGNEKDARNIMQEAFILLWSKKEKLDISNCLKAYLSKVIRNKSIDLIRKKNRTHHNLWSENKELAQQINIAVGSRSIWRFFFLKNIQSFRNRIHRGLKSLRKKLKHS
ncbi:RNA polymerase sigma factor, sigma-70 family [Chitinophaga sp. YR573]|uniref:RNA polymerase sigma factor n=1 Tax=Chitinophaga sp. YR573 TaxID=1881040 RepID=UPI0008CDB601|nr:sigma factor [Chitinophaga sp. YR573]SEW03626.1 RNA polymerase sigma factor, sigma-70 family [Chitinophaga sp. YR573]